jgi:hypothetical protein
MSTIVTALDAGASPYAAASVVHRQHPGVPEAAAKEAAELIQRARQLLRVGAPTSGAAAIKAGEGL